CCAPGAAESNSSGRANGSIAESRLAGLRLDDQAQTTMPRKVAMDTTVANALIQAIMAAAPRPARNAWPRPDLADMPPARLPRSCLAIAPAPWRSPRPGKALPNA